MLYRLSRFSPIHRVARKLSYAVLWNLPRTVKEPVLHSYLRRRLPYSVVQKGDTVIQIGAPWDILKSGRSRFIHFLRRVGDAGRVVVIEPDADNVAAVQAYAERHGIRNLTVVPKGAWDKRTTLKFMVDPQNPASNLVVDVLDNTRTDLDRFESSQIEVDTVDAIVDELALEDVSLVSITSNGSENKILAGMSGLQARLPYIATIGEQTLYPLLEAYGYRTLGGDDRGYTFLKNV